MPQADLLQRCELIDSQPEQDTDDFPSDKARRPGGDGVDAGRDRKGRQTKERPDDQVAKPEQGQASDWPAAGRDEGRTKCDI